MKNVRRHILCNALILAVSIGATASNAQAQEAVEGMNFDVPAQTAVSALNAFAEQADITLVFSQDLVAGVTTHPLMGVYTTTEGLRAMLEGTGLAIQRINDSTISITGGSPPSGIDQASAQPGNATRTLDTVTVTGTRIRGGETPSPVITIGSERIKEEGFNDLGEVIRSIPQNFSGGQNPGSGAGNIAGAGDAQQNLTGGSSLNLRGLGGDATLTLLNGRRMAYGGFTQSVDISAIPIAAVDRLEIVSDGASAIYGSDAVGGVANVIMKRDFDGVMIGARYGDSGDGGLATREYSVIAGTTWTGGGLLATYEDVSADPIYTDKRDYTEQMVDPSTLYPGSDLTSALISAYQALGNNIEVRLDAFRTKREQLQYYNYGGRATRVAPETTTSLISPSIEFKMPSDWTLTLGGALGKGDHRQSAVQTVISTNAAFVSDDCFCNEAVSYEAGAEGPLFKLRGGEARLAVGVGYRKNSFEWYNYATRTNTIEGEEAARFAYAELNLPIVGPEQGIAGVKRLALTGAVRGEDYDSFGRVATPKLGLIYGPNSDITFKASWGRSFKAPTLFQQYWGESIYLYPAAALGGTGYPPGATAMYRYGGNANLEPEHARTWSASLAFHPEALPGLEAELSFFSIDFTDRVMQAISGNGFSQSLSNPIHAEFVDYSPTPERLAEVLASTPNFYDLTGAGYDPSDVIAIIEGRNVNVARQEVRGIDASGSYRFDVGAGRLTLRGSASWLDSTRQNSATQGQSAYELAGTLFNPPRLGSRIGAVFNQDGFSASLFGNYKGGVTNIVDNRKTASFTTFDATVRYATRADGGAWSGLEFATSLDNIFDREPPLHVVSMPIYVPPFDQANYSAIGRYLSLSVSKRW